MKSTPGCNASSVCGLRPSLGSCMIVSLSIALPIEASVVLIVSVAAETSTETISEFTCSFMFTVAGCATSSAAVVVNLPNPGAVAVIV